MNEWMNQSIKSINQWCIICNYNYFLKVNCKFQPKACDGCHYLMQKAIFYAKTNDYGTYFWYVKDEDINIKKNFDWKQKNRLL